MISFVDAHFLNFARQNNAPHLDREAVVGTSLWNHIDDSSTRHIYRVLLAKVRETHQPVNVPFRCDGPREKRHMELEILPATEGGVEFHSKLIRLEEADEAWFFQRQEASAARLLIMCSWCKRIASPEWLEVEAAAQKLRLLVGDFPFAISHGICDDCKAQFDIEG